MSEKKITGRVIALGYFDGVHSGHRRIMRRAVQIAKSINAEPSVATFDTLPKTKNVLLLNTLDERKYLISRFAGIDDVVVLHADSELLAMKPEQFVSYMSEKYNAAGFVCGENFKFGYQGSGDENTLKMLCKQNGCAFESVKLLSEGGQPISSSRIRELIASGAVDEAAKLLGHPHILSGVISHGERLGHDLGAPTINIEPPENIVKPARGVYITRAVISDENGENAYPSISNFGINPSVEAKLSIPRLETHLLNYAGDLYDKKVIIEFIKYVRPEKEFANYDELREAIASDVMAAAKWFGE